VILLFWYAAMLVSVAISTLVIYFVNLFFLEIITCGQHASVTVSDNEIVGALEYIDLLDVPPEL
jgi:hypothetical protein